MSKFTSVEEKIRLLLAKAESTEYEAEREAFMAQASRLMARHNITSIKEDISQSLSDEIVERHIDFEDSYRHELVTGLGWCARAMGARSYRKTWRYHPEQPFMLVAYSRDIEVFHTLMNSVVTQTYASMWKWWQSSGKYDYPTVDGYTSYERLVARRSYIQGFLAGVSDQIQAIYNDELFDDSDGRSLVVLRDARLDDFVTSVTKGKKGRKSRMDYDPLAWNAGQEDSDHINLEAETPLETQVIKELQGATS